MMKIIDEMLVIINKESKRNKSSLYQNILLKNTTLKLSKYIIEHPRTLDKNAEYILSKAYHNSVMYHVAYQILDRIKIL